MTTYKETILFLGKCLTLYSEGTHRDLVRQMIESDKVNWENVVQVSTAQYVFPALYVNYREVNFLSMLPEDLVAFMEEIFYQNRERNEQIIKEAKEIDVLLKKQGITPMFLKGTALLLDGLYQDIGERMVGDIDFLVPESQMVKAWKALSTNGYEKVKKRYFRKTVEQNVENSIFNKHLPRIAHNDKIAAVEVHCRVLRDVKGYDFEAFENNAKQTVDGYKVQGHQDQLMLAALSDYHNDMGYQAKRVSLRKFYDVYLLSFKVSTLKALENYPAFDKKLNAFMVAVHYVFGNPKNIQFKGSKRAQKFLKGVDEMLNNLKKDKEQTLLAKILRSAKKATVFLFKSFKDKRYAKHLWVRLTSKAWYKAYFLGK